MGCWGETADQGLEEQQIPAGNDRKKSKCNSKDKCKSKCRFFAALRMTVSFLGVN